MREMEGLSPEEIQELLGQAGTDGDVPMSKGPSAALLATLSREQRALLFERLRQRRERAAEAPGRIPRRAPAADPPPASFAQERLWVIDRLQPGLATYNMPLALRIDGVLSPAMLQAVLGEVVRRHEVLRTTFREIDGRPAQEIAPPGRWEVPLADLSGLPPAVREGLARRLAQEESERPFDLRRGPLLRATLLRLAPAEHALLLGMHHIVSDGWSLGVMVREITALYGATLAGAPSPLPGLGIQYADFAVWQREWLQGERLERQLAYWRERLAGAPPALGLPADRPPTAGGTRAGARLQATFDRGLTREVGLLAQRSEATPFMVLLAALHALLARITGGGDVTVGSPIAGRNRAEVEPLIGFFVNTLVLRGDLTGEPSFRELVARARKTTLEAYAHQDLPFERLVEELRPERLPGVTPFFQVLLTLQNAPVEAARLSGLSLAPVPLETRTAIFDLELSFVEIDGRLTVDLSYSTERFDPPTPHRLVRHLEALLQGLLADPERPAAEAPLLSAGERQQLLLEWNDPPPGPAPLLLHDAAAHWARLTPAAVALAEGGREVAYEELERRANRLANHLRALGVGPEARVALVMERSLDAIVAILGILKAGGAYVPIDPATPAERLAFLLADVRPALLVAGGGTAARLPERPVPVLDLDAEGERVAAASAEPPGVEVDPDNLAYVIYTSGSTGRPKGVAIRHRSATAFAAAACRMLGLGASDRVVMFASLVFDASVQEIFSPWVAGAAVLPRTGPLEEPARFLAACAEMGATALHLSTAYWHQTAALIEAEGLALPPRVHTICIGGDRVIPELLGGVGERPRPPGPALQRLWADRDHGGDHLPGPSAGPGRPRRTAGVADRPAGDRRGARPRGRSRPAAGAGRVERRGGDRRRGLGARLLRPPGADRGAVRPGPPLRRARSAPLPHGGPRLPPPQRPPGVRRAPRRAGQDPRLPHRAGGGRGRSRHPSRGARGGGGGQPGGGRAARLRGAGRSRAPPGRGGAAVPARPPSAPFMVPGAFAVLSELPLTPTGKVDRRALQRLEPARPAGGGTPPRTPAERAMADLWREVLGVAEARREDDFFTLGGHSLLATQLAARVRATLGVEIPIRQLFEHPVLADFAALVAAGPGSPRRSRRPPGHRGTPGRSPPPSPRNASGSSTAWSRGTRRSTWARPCACGGAWSRGPWSGR